MGDEECLVSLEMIGLPCLECFLIEHPNLYLLGDRVYQALRVSAKPIDEFPAKVTRRVLRSAN
jgi:hypothetical protein